jgi:hypothetical protein
VLNWLSIKPWRRMWNKCIGDLILDLAWRRIVSFTPLPLYSPWKNRRYLLCGRLCEPQYRSGRRRAEKTLAPTGATLTPTLGRPARKRMRSPHSYYQNNEVRKRTACSTSHKHTSSVGDNKQSQWHNVQSDKQVKKNSMVWVRERTILTELPPVVGEVMANFLRIEGATWSAWRIPKAVFSVFLDRSLYFSIK